MRTATRLIAFALGLFAATPLAAQADRDTLSQVELSRRSAVLDSLRRAHEAGSLRVAELAGARERAAAWAEEGYREIAAARERKGSALRDALAAAQIASDSLAVLDQWLSAAVTFERRARQALTAALEAELEQTISAADRAPADRRNALVERAGRLSAELAALQRPLQVPAAELPVVVVEVGDGPEEIALKADFLSDRAAQYRSAAEAVAEELARTERRDQLREEMRRLVTEVRLFDQTGVPPAAAADAAGATGNEAPTLEGDRALGVDERTSPANVPLDLTLRSLESNPPSRAEPRSVTEQLALLRADLLRRAEALENQARTIRRLLRDER